MTFPDKKETVRTLAKKLDVVFNSFIRLRDSKEYGFTAFKCISCGKLKNITKGKSENNGWSNFHAGHYYHGSISPALRWNEKNVNGQCSQCNYHLHGNQIGYTEGLKNKYGKGIIEYLEVTKRNRMKLFPFEVKALIQEYQQKIKEFQLKKVA